MPGFAIGPIVSGALGSGGVPGVAGLGNLGLPLGSAAGKPPAPGVEGGSEVAPGNGVNPGFLPIGGVGAGEVLGGFGQSLSQAIQSLQQLQSTADLKSTQLAAGEQIELHDVLLAADRASLGMQLAVQVRNKLVEAYQDVMRMQL